MVSLHSKGGLSSLLFNMVIYPEDCGLEKVSVEEKDKQDTEIKDVR